MISQYQKEIALMAHRHVDELFDERVDPIAYSQALQLVSLIAQDVRPILKDLREGVDLINEKIRYENNNGNDGE